MKVEIVRYNENLAADWDHFVSNSINGTFLHSRGFFNHNSLNKKDDHSFLFYKKNEIIAVIPFALIQKEHSNILNSHARATYGGFVVNKNVGLEEAVEMVNLIISEAKKINALEIIIRNPFRIFHQTMCDETDYAMWHKGFNIKSRELEIAIDLKGDIDDIRKNYQNGAKYNVKKALKHVNSDISDDYETFWKLLEENLKDKFDTKPVHSIADFKSLINNVGRENIKLFAGFVNDEMVCGVIVFLFKNKTIHSQYIASNKTHQEIRPLNAVIDYIIEWGVTNRYKYYNMGMVNEEAGTIVNYGLCHFKEGFGGRGTLRETMSLTFSEE